MKYEYKFYRRHSMLEVSPTGTNAFHWTTSLMAKKEVFELLNLIRITVIMMEPN